MLCWIKSVKVGGGKCYLDRKNQRKGCVKLGKYLNVGDSVCKFFTYVTKTRANLTTYSRKLENCNGTINFWDWYHEKFLPNQFKSLSNLTFSQIFWLFLLFWFTLKLSWECCESSRKEVLFWFCQWQKIWILNWVGMSFSWCQSQK